MLSKSSESNFIPKCLSFNHTRHTDLCVGSIAGPGPEAIIPDRPKLAKYEHGEFNPASELHVTF